MDVGMESDVAALPCRRLFTMQAQLNPSLDSGEAALGRRSLNAIASGHFAGPKLNGTLIPAPATGC